MIEDGLTCLVNIRELGQPNRQGFIRTYARCVDNTRIAIVFPERYRSNLHVPGWHVIRGVQAGNMCGHYGDFFLAMQIEHVPDHPAECMHAQWVTRPERQDPAPNEVRDFDDIRLYAVSCDRVYHAGGYSWGFFPANDGAGRYLAAYWASAAFAIAPLRNYDLILYPAPCFHPRCAQQLFCVQRANETRCEWEVEYEQ